MRKQDLRKLYIQKRKELQAVDIDHLSSEIVRQFSSVSLSGIRYLHVFYPMVGRQEFNSLLLADNIRAEHSEILLVLPKSDLQNHTLKHIIWTVDTPLSMNEWGITEPESGIEVTPEKIDMIILPLLAFDRRGNRLGYGKGFYDRFLAECRATTKKIGISFFEPEETIEAEEHDIPLDLCITPRKIWVFN